MYKGYITDVSGVKVGHAQDAEGATGVTVILVENGCVAGVDVRGSAPGTRETDLLRSTKMIEKIHGIVLSGGSAYGLESASGVMKYLEEKKIGFDVGVGVVPIVPGAVIFDMDIGDPKIRPTKLMGYQAAKEATVVEDRQGNVGAGMGATVGKILGYESSMKGGLGSATVKVDDLYVSALVVVNAMGDIYNSITGEKIAGVYDYNSKKHMDTIELMKEGYKSSNTNTTLAVVATNAKLSKDQANKVAQMAHNGYARSIVPVHTTHDGDTIFAISCGEVVADVNLVGVLAIEAIEKGIINAITSATSYNEIKSYKDL